MYRVKKNQLVASLVFFCICMIFTHSDAAILAESHFATNSDGWTVPGGSLTWESEGGNPGGWVSGFNAGWGEWAYYAPEKFCGDISASYGMELAFDFFTDGDEDISKSMKIKLRNEFKTIYLDSGYYYSNNSWTAISVTLDTTDLWMIHLLEGDRKATEEEIRFVLNDLDGLYIIGGPFDHTGLDNVVLHATPIPSALLLFGSGIVGIVGIRKKIKK